MRWLAVVLFCSAIALAAADPEPKKYKTETKENKNNGSLTDEERQFLREVEAKFGIKSDIPIAKETKSNVSDVTEEDVEKPIEKSKLPFPAIIAIEIVNDTETNSKGKKRTIDANLGYGYRTNNGYTYTSLGKPSQEKGKFMIYPYSQHDIPPGRQHHKQNNNGHGQTLSKQPQFHSYGSTRQNNKHTTPSTNVEIQPSQAYELVPVQEQLPYQSKQPQVEVKTKGVQQYAVHENPHSAEVSSPPSTLYTTYNGGQLSGLSSQFPAVMSNYLVDSAQLLRNPQYQNAGLTTDHLRSHGPQVEQSVVPVLVLRIPSSYLRNPSAELYANIPQNYPISQYLNNVNLQELVNQYFKKIGYPYAPQVMTYQNPIPVPPANYEPQQYAAPQVSPMYTHADYSGVQYSAVQPVMAKYPMASSQAYSQQQYFVPQSQAMYQQVIQHPQYEYQYQYVQPTQSYYYPQYQTSESQRPTIPQENHVHESSEYRVPQAGVEYETSGPSPTAYVQRNKPHAVYGPVEHTAAPTQYSPPKVDYSNYSAKKRPGSDNGPTKVPISLYGKTTSAEHESPRPKYGAPKTVPAEYGVPKSAPTEYGVPKNVHTSYDPPKTVSTTYERPNHVATEYGPPKTVESAYGPPKTESAEYRAPNSVATAYGPPKTVPAEYGAPNSVATAYGPPKTVSAEYGAPNSVATAYGPPKTVSTEYGSPNSIATAYGEPNTFSAGYGAPNAVTNVYGPPKASVYAVPHSVATEYRAPNAISPAYGVPHRVTASYRIPLAPMEYEAPTVSTAYGAPKETVAIFATDNGQNSYNYQINPESGGTQSYIYQKYISPESQSKSIIISENYPSKDHTQVTVLPFNYKSVINQDTASHVQNVNYVTPSPYNSKYQQQYSIVVPQDSLKHDEKVTYVNSHSIPSHFVHVGPASDDYNPEEEYKVAPGYAPPVGSQKPPEFPQNYHSNLKRMVKNKDKQETATVSKDKKEKQPEKKEERKSQ